MKKFLPSFPTAVALAIAIYLASFLISLLLAPFFALLFTPSMGTEIGIFGYIFIFAIWFVASYVTMATYVKNSNTKVSARNEIITETVFAFAVIGVILAFLPIGNVAASPLVQVAVAIVGMAPVALGMSLVKIK